MRGVEGAALASLDPPGEQRKDLLQGGKPTWLNQTKSPRGLGAFGVVQAQFFLHTGKVRPWFAAYGHPTHSTRQLWCRYRLFS